MIWKNGKIVSDSEANYSIYDSALMYGDVAFEMMRTFNKQTFKLWEHLERLFASLKMLEIEIPYSFDDMFDAHENLLIHNRKDFKEDDEIRSLINVSRGLLPMYSDMGEMGTNVIITCFPLRRVLKGNSHFYSKGVHAIVPSQRAIPEYLLDPKIKSRSRQHLMMANLEVMRTDKDAMALMLSPDGCITEGTGSNFFLVKGNKIFTPRPVHCLRGISRGYVIQLARELKMTVVQTDLTLYDAVQADEMFFTNTPYCILPITRINGKIVGNGKPGHKTKKLMDQWNKTVNCDFINQAIGWDNAKEN